MNATCFRSEATILAVSLRRILEMGRQLPAPENHLTHFVQSIHHHKGIPELYRYTIMMITAQDSVANTPVSGELNEACAQWCEHIRGHITTAPNPTTATATCYNSHTHVSADAGLTKKTNGACKSQTLFSNDHGLAKVC